MNDKKQLEDLIGEAYQLTGNIIFSKKKSTSEEIRLLDLVGIIIPEMIEKL